MSIVSTLLTCLRNLQRGGTERSLHDQLVKRDGEGRSVLHLAASSGSKETFITVLDAFRQERVHGGKDDHVKNPSSARDDVRTTSSISSPFHSTRDVFAPEVEREEMQDILLKGADAGSTVLMAAASSGSKSIFHAAVTATEEVLTSQQIENELNRRDKQGCSLLHLAAASGKKRAVDAVWNACRWRLSEDELWGILTSKDKDTNVSALMAAAESGSAETFKAVIRCARDVNKLRVGRGDGPTFEKLKEVLSQPRQDDGGKVLGVAVTSRHKIEELAKKEYQDLAVLERVVTRRHKSAVDAVWNACRDLGMKTKELKEDRLKKTLHSMGGGHPQLRKLGSTFGKTAVDAVWEVRNKLRLKGIELNEHELEREVETGDKELRGTVMSGLKDALDAVWEVRMELGLQVDVSGDFHNDESAALTAPRKEKQDDIMDKKLGMITLRDVVGDTLLSKAVDSGDVVVFKAVRNFAWVWLDPNQRAGLVASKNIFGESLLGKAFDHIKRGDEDLFEAVLEVAWDALPPSNVSSVWQLLEFIDSRDVDGAMSAVDPEKAINLGKLLLPKAFETGDLGIFEAAVNCVIGRGMKEKSVDDERPEGAGSAAGTVEDLPFFRDCTALVDEIIWNDLDGVERLFATAMWELLNISGDLNPSGDFRLKFFSARSNMKVAALRTSHMDHVFASCVDRHLGEHGHHEELQTLSTLLANSARPSATDLRHLSQRYESGDLFKSCCLRAVTSAANPFIPGITLSIRLGEAAKLAHEGDRRKIEEIQSSIVDLVLEIFERLPRTVGSFERMAGKGACARMLEPTLEGLAAHDDYKELRGGPLDMILSERQQLEIFCKVPLIMDFLSREFRRGLPALKFDVANVLPGLRGQEEAKDIYQGWNDLDYVVDNGLVPGSSLGHRLSTLCGKAGVAMASVNFFPAADFIFQGVFAAPTEYRTVPAMRMALDFVVYLGMVAALSYLVLFHSTTGTLRDDGIVDRDFRDAERICALMFITSGVYRERREMHWDIGMYLKDKWNVLDALGLLCVSVGLVFRWGDWRSPWGPAFYSLSAPLVVSRILFFAQILPYQGPMIQVIFRMTSKILQFGAVMAVVMIGFAMALHALFRDLDSFGQTFLGLFKAMLGDTAFFDEFSGGRYDDVASFLVILYLFIVTIMLLNLLIAILSTAHSQWVMGTCRMVIGICMPDKTSDGDREELIVESILRKGSRGVGADKLREFVENTMEDDDVRQDEKEKKSTVEHVKLLRDRLERRMALKSDVEELRNNVKEVLARLPVAAPSS
eukprot:g8110.t1